MFPATTGHMRATSKRQGPISVEGHVQLIKSLQDIPDRDAAEVLDAQPEAQCADIEFRHGRGCGKLAKAEGMQDQG